MTNSTYQEQLSQIISMAQSNDNTISYIVAVDLLKDKDNQISDSELEKVMCDLQAHGIQVTMQEEGEDYSAKQISDDSFIPADVRIQTKLINVSGLLERLYYGEINLTPLYQRHQGLWNDEQQSRLIESLMLKIPLPAFYFDASDENYWVVIDGLQRLTTFQNYIKPSEPSSEMVSDVFQPAHKLTGLQYLKQFNGKTFSELPRQYIRRINEAQLVLYLVDRGTPDEIVRNIFQRINTGGLTLSDQEIRHALYQGNGTKLTEELANSESFLNATQNMVRPDRMADREYINRYLAFTELNYETDYKENIDKFLSLALKNLRHCSSEKYHHICDNFNRTMDLCYFLFGKYAFRTQNKDWRRGPLNKALFEVCSVCFSTLSQHDEIVLRSHQSEFLNAFHDLLQDDLYRRALHNGDLPSVRRRINMTQRFLEDFICSKK